MAFEILSPLKFYHSGKGDLYSWVGVGVLKTAVCCAGKTGLFCPHNVHLSGFIPSITQRMHYKLSPTRKIKRCWNVMQDQCFDRTENFIMLVESCSLIYS